MQFVTDGLVIRETSFGDFDRYVTILTRDRGIISAFVKSARRRNNKNQAATSLLSYSSFTVFANRDTYKVNEANAIEVFFDLRTDIEKMALSQYFCELLSAILPDDAESEEILRLILNSLHFLCKKESDPNLIKAITELRLLSLAGYMPDLVGCEVCSDFEKGPMFFDSVGGVIYCPEHKTGSGLIELDRTTFAAMRHILYSSMDKLYHFTVPPIAAKYLSYVTERYMLSQLERGFKTLDFFHGLSLGIEKEMRKSGIE